MPVLLLDSTMEPIKVISWRKSIEMVYTGDAEVIEESEERVRSATRTWVVPSVIRQFKKFRRKAGVHFSRINIYMRDGWTCQYCGEQKEMKELTFDHVLPRCQGGKTNWTNIVTACKGCNVEKDARTPAQAGMKLLKQPIEPKWLPQRMVVKVKKIPREWEPYVDMRSMFYWTAELESD